MITYNITPGERENFFVLFLPSFFNAKLFQQEIYLKNLGTVSRKFEFKHEYYEL